MSLVRLQDVSLSFGAVPLLRQANMEIAAGERVCLLGRNGAGKTSLLRLLLGQQQPDAGRILVGTGVRIAALPQQVPAGLEGQVQALVRAAVPELTAALLRYEQLSGQAGADVTVLSALQAQIEQADGWTLESRVQRVLSQLQLAPAAEFTQLSGGQQRRVLLARALVQAPDLLLLDEPTNHLDIQSIEWLEGALSAFAGAILFTTHDRAFLQAMATRILELDLGQLSSWPGDYANYLRRREERLAAEAQAEALFDRRLAAEEAWIRQGIEARRTRNQGRVKRLLQLRQARGARLVRQAEANVQLQAAARSGQLVCEVRDVSFGYGAMPLLREFSTLIQRGDRVAVLGPNGAGKTTLLRLLTGELAPQQGEVRLGTRLEIAYFDQHRAALDEQARVQDVVADGRDFVEIGGVRRHIMGYLQDYLFTPARARSEVAALSGGERARLLLARLFAQPSNLLVLDEPTNDLDMETLELLEEQLLEYPGTLLLVSHDRAFIDRVATSTLVLADDGRVAEYVGGYSDWLRQRPTPPTAPALAAVPQAQTAAGAAQATGSKRKLSYKEQQELTHLPARLATLEAQIAALQQALAAPALYQQADAGAQVSALQAQLAAAEADLEQALERWVALEG